MVTLTHIPEEYSDNRYVISGENIDELVSACLVRIRERSKAYYREELYKDLNEKGCSMIDLHAGMGSVYRVELTGENGCRARAKRFLLARLYNEEAVEQFVETNWSWVLSDNQNVEKFESWVKIVFSQSNDDKVSDILVNSDNVICYPGLLCFCAPLSDTEFLYCRFHRQQLQYIRNSVEEKWFKYYKDQPAQLISDCKENKAVRKFADAHKLWIVATIDVNDITVKEATELFKVYQIAEDDYRQGQERNQVISEMYFEQHLAEFIK